MSRRWVAIAALLALSGCGVPDASESAQPTTASAQVDGQQRFVPSLAPIVADPRDARAVSPCDLLTPEQENELGFDPESEALGGEVNRGCEWRSLDGEGVIGTVAVQDPLAGLEGLYQVRSAYLNFEPGEIDGRPVVRADSSDGSGRDCRIFIGVADDQMIQVSAGFPYEPDRGCQVARAMASAAIANLPPPS